MKENNLYTKYIQQSSSLSELNFTSFTIPNKNNISIINQ